MIRLEVVQGIDAGRVFQSDESEIVIGRASTARLQLNDTHLSGEHALIFRHDDQYICRDLRSTNGSAVVRGDERFLIDGSERWECTIGDGDRLLLGDAASPVILSCSISQEEQADLDRTARILATRELGQLDAVMGKVEQSRDLSALYRALKLLNGRIELDELLDAAAGAVFALVSRATHVSILLRDGADERRFVPMRARSRDGEQPSEPVMMSRAVLRRVLDDRAAVLAANAADELSDSESIMAAKIRSTIGIPLWSGDQIFGVLQADNRSSSGLFTERDLELLLLLAEQMALAIDNAQLYRRLQTTQETVQRENAYLKGRQRHINFDNMIGASSKMQEIFHQLERVIDTRATVCIRGETGTGKELVAAAIHQQGKRRNRLLVAQNCAALPESLLESELFGHEKGAFTGADQPKKGLFEIADGGTLFLDEIGEMPAALQAKVLRALQEGEVRPLGSTRAKQVDVRIICATNKNLEQEVEAGRFRQDLFYRLMVFPITLPPLRERSEDIPALLHHFLERYTREMHKTVGGISQEALNQLTAYQWPGNIRELENEVQRLIIQVDEDAIICSEDLSPRIRPDGGTRARIAAPDGTLKQMMGHVERQLLTEALKQHNNNKTKTAASLGITREGLHKKLVKLKL